jgi:hypothetical protein
MPIAIYARPDGPEADTSTVPATRGWLDEVWARINSTVHTNWFLYALCGLLVLLLALSLRSRNKRTRAEQEGRKADLTFADRAVTRITGILATAVVATGAWKVFGLPALHLHPAVRLVLFFFAEAQVIAAWRRVRRHIHRHAELGQGTRTIYGIALGSATVAAFDASGTVEVLLRFFAAFVAAYMIVEELAEELDIHLTAFPHLRTEERKKPKRGLFGFKWALTPERIMVWLRLAEPTERTVEEIERQRRVARFARTAYRLHLLEERDSWKWRIWVAEWRLRRQTESGNEHLKLATDDAALREVRAQLALLYGAKSGTSRLAVADLSPLRPPQRLAIAAEPWTPEPATDGASHDATEPVTLDAIEAIVGAAIETAMATVSQPATEPDANAANPNANPNANPPAPRPATGPRLRTASRGGNGDVPKAAKDLARALAKWPAATQVDLAKRTGLSDRTVSRHIAAARAINAAKDAADDDQERPPMAPFTEPQQGVLAGVNGSHFNPQEN